VCYPGSGLDASRPFGCRIQKPVPRDYAECMRLITLAGFGETEVLRIDEAAKPEPGDGEVLIRVAAAGINRADL
jgi:hypothetical protein